MPVHADRTSAISSSSTSERTSISLDFHSRSREAFSSSSPRSSSRNRSARSRSWASMADSFFSLVSAIRSSISRTLGGALIRRSRMRDPASSMRSMALSGRNRSLM